MGDRVNHPPHYNKHPSGVECIEITEHMTFNLGNAVKYIWRAGLKSDNPIEDLQKARWYLDREISRLKAAPKSAHTVMPPDAFMMYCALQDLAPAHDFTERFAASLALLDNNLCWSRTRVNAAIDSLIRSGWAEDGAVFDGGEQRVVRLKA